MKYFKQLSTVLFIPVLIAIMLTSCFQGTANTQTTTPVTSTITSQTQSTSTPTNSSTSTGNSNSDNSAGNGQPVPGGSPPGAPGGEPPGESGNSTAVEGTGAYTQNGQNVSKSGETITAANADESAIKVTDSGVLSLSNSTITTSGNASSMDSASFYGLNAAVLAESGSKITLSDSTIDTTGTGANGAFATGSGSSIELSNVQINCTASVAHGVDATNGGALTLNDVNITTAGNGASAAIATDRGGGTITVTGGTVKTTGTKSPCIYSTGKITTNGGTMTATGSEAVVIEGKNSVTLNDTAISGAKNWGVLIYQSMSGDASVGTGNFTMNGGSLTAAEGPLFYITNTDAVISLKGASLAASGTLLKASAGDWGTNGSNGGTVAFTADNETLNGDIVCDNISSVKAELKNNTTLTGAINTENTAKSVSLTLDSTSTWNVTCTSYITSLSDEDTTLANIKDNGHTIYYDASNSENSWLNGKTITLTDGGTLTPE